MPESNWNNQVPVAFSGFILSRSHLNLLPRFGLINVHLRKVEMRVNDTFWNMRDYNWRPKGGEGGGPCPNFVALYFKQESLKWYIFTQKSLYLFVFLVIFVIIIQNYHHNYYCNHHYHHHLFLWEVFPKKLNFIKLQLFKSSTVVRKKEKAFAVCSSGLCSPPKPSQV